MPRVARYAAPLPGEVQSIAGSHVGDSRSGRSAKRCDALGNAPQGPKERHRSHSRFRQDVRVVAKRHHPPFGAARSSAAAENRLDEWSRSVKPPSFRGQCNPGDSACISLPRASARPSPEGHGRLPRSSQTLRTVCLARPKRKRESTWSCSYFWWRRWESNYPSEYRI